MSTSLTDDPEIAFGSAADRFAGLFDAWSPHSPAWDDDAVNELAREAFQVQYSGNRAYRLYCESRDIAPSAVRTWREVPPVPTAAFRVVDLIVGDPSQADLVFRTSGTTRGVESRGRHLVRRPDLYRSSLRAAFRHFVMQDDVSRIIITLLPSFTMQPDSSLGWMLDDVRTGLGAVGSASVARPRGIDWHALRRTIDSAAEEGNPVCILGTTLSFAAWQEHLETDAPSLPPLPVGSRLMDTGGVKGRGEILRDELMMDLAGRLGLGRDAVVNEFGMTELLSQRYATGGRTAPLVGPPWLRTRVLDPIDLRELPDGETGILCHFDLANLGSVCAVLTEDRGRVVGDGIEWLGRTPGAPPRGCSLATSELLNAQNDA